MMLPITLAAPAWIRDCPDPRDWLYDAERARLWWSSLGRRARGALPNRCDLREYFAPIGESRSAATATAASCVALVQYFERRASGRLLDLSADFLQDVAARLGGSSASAEQIRQVLKALVRYGAPPQRLWTQAAERRDPLLYGYAREWSELAYVRLDAPGQDGSDTLKCVRGFLAAGWAIVGGFAVPDSITGEADIPWPTQFDTMLGGQPIVLAGYDDTRRIRSTKGALLVRTAWGNAWGEQGYGWLPYEYIEQHVAVDFWTVVQPRWLESGEFQRPI